MDEHFTPQQFVNYHCKQIGVSIEDLGVAPTVIGCFSLGLARGLAEKVDAKRQELWMYDQEAPLWTGSVAGRPVSFTRFLVGAPATVMQMEELIACGARRFIGLGWAGSLQPDVPAGSLLIPTKCLREEGTSSHYMPPEVDVEPDPELAAALAEGVRRAGHEPHIGRHWTIDAPYRELRSKVQSYRAHGVLGVDMETSAMYALGAFRGVSVANLLAVSDELWHEWRPAFRSEEVRRAGSVLIEAVLYALAERA